MEAHVRAVRRKQPRDRSAMGVPVAAVVLAGALLLGGLTFVSQTSPVDVTLSGISFESVMNNAIDATGDIAGGNAFKESSPTSYVSSAPEAAPPPAPAAVTPPPVDLATLTGNPYSASAAVDVWKAAGYTVSQQPSPAGMQPAGGAAAFRLEKGDSTVSVVLFVYPDSKAVGQDWQAASGQKPQVKPDRPLPAFQTVWWNRNLVVGVLEQSGGSKAALDAFFSLK
jgi:hypothetical protein